jgi:DNA-binding response OmpR family regulator
MRVLIADDDKVSRHVLASHLHKLGHEVVATDNGRQAWNAFQDEHFPLLISDWIMPEVDGLELCRMVRAEKRTRYTYVMLLTVMAGKGSYLEGMSAGADDFVTKPFDDEQLAARIRVAERILNLQTEVRRLEGLLPICSYCKKIRDERDAWAPIEEFVARRTEASFSHGICPECFENHVIPDLARTGMQAPVISIR